jgi:hypothetical protein
VILDHTNPMCFLSLAMHWLHALIGLHKPYTYRIWVHIWVVLLSPTIMSVVEVLHLS